MNIQSPEIGATPLQGVQSILQNLVIGQSAMTAAINALTAQIQSGGPHWVPVPATATSTGVAGDAAYEPGFLYICVSSNVWQRVAIATF